MLRFNTTLLQHFDVCLWVLFQSNIGLILHAVMEFKLSLEFLSNALQLNVK